MSATAMVVCYGVAVLLTNALVPFPFMDERFHYRQFVKWHQLGFHEYDPMITTPPGLYVLPLALYGVCCGRASVGMLRASNLLYIAVMWWAVPKRKRAVVLTNPLLLFYTTLYYTDVPALSMCLAYQRLLSANQFTVGHLTSALAAGVMALMMRQTCIVWIGFACVLVLCEKPVGPNLAKAKWPLLITLTLGALFALFLHANHGIAIGDRQHHRPTMHTPNLFYCSTFVALLNWPSLRVTRLFRRHWRPIYGLLAAPIVLLFHYNTHHHPYLYTDDRHLVNLLWKHVLRREECRLVVAALLALPSLFLLFASVLEHRGWLVATGFVASMAAVTVPTPLVEARYYMAVAVAHLLLVRASVRARRVQVAWNTVLAVSLLAVFWHTADPSRPEHRLIL